MTTAANAAKLERFNFRKPQMWAFRISRFAFLLCLFVWLGIAPLMQIIRAEFAQTKAQVGDGIIASVPIIVRLFVGWPSA